LYQIKQLAEGLLQSKIYSPTTEPVVGNEYDIGDDKNGRFKVKVLKNRQIKSLVVIVSKLSEGTRRKTASFQIGQQITVPFSFFKS
jgi:hypothetical protein